MAMGTIQIEKYCGFEHVLQQNSGAISASLEQIRWLPSDLGEASYSREITCADWDEFMGTYIRTDTTAASSELSAPAPLTGDHGQPTIPTQRFTVMKKYE